jgi:hypothetical protein
MRQPIDVHSIQKLIEFRDSLARFGGTANDLLISVQAEIARSIEWIDARHIHWQREVERASARLYSAEIDLARCRASGYRDPDGVYHHPECSREHANVRKAKQDLEQAQLELAKVSRWRARIKEAIARYQVQARRFSGVLQSDLSKASAIMDRYIEVLGAYAASGFRDTAFHLAEKTSSPLDVRGNWTNKEIVYVDLDDIDGNRLDVQSTSDFEKISYHQVEMGMKVLEDDIMPFVKRGNDPDAFSDHQRRIYASFYQEPGCIRLERIGSDYYVKNGHHRLFVAKQLGMKSIPAMVVEWNPKTDVEKHTNYPPEFKEGNLGGPERKG